MMRTTFVLCAVLNFSIILAVHATPAINSNENVIPVVNHNFVEDEMLRKLSTRCHRERDHESCVRYKWFVNLSRIFKKSLININENLQVTQNREIEEITFDPEDDALLARSLDSEDETYALLVAGKLWKFIRSRTLRYKFSDNANFVVRTEPTGNLNIGVSISPVESLQEGRGKMKNMAPLMMMLATKAGIVGAIILKALFLLAGKALIVSKIALLLSVIIALKKLLTQKKHIVEIPHHDSYSSGWARALDGFIEGIAAGGANAAQDMAYAAQKPAAETTI